MLLLLPSKQCLCVILFILYFMNCYNSLGQLCLQRQVQSNNDTYETKVVLKITKTTEKYCRLTGSLKSN